MPEHHFKLLSIMFHSHSSQNENKICIKMLFFQYFSSTFFSYIRETVDSIQTKIGKKIFETVLR